MGDYFSKAAGELPPPWGGACHMLWRACGHEVSMNAAHATWQKGLPSELALPVSVPRAQAAHVLKCNSASSHVRHHGAETSHALPQRPICSACGSVWG